MLHKLRWRDLSISWKYGMALLCTILLFIASATVVFVLLSNTKEKIDTLEQSAQHATDITSMASLFREKDIISSDYIVFAENEKLTSFENATLEMKRLEDKIMLNLHTDEQQTLFQ